MTQSSSTFSSSFDPDERIRLFIGLRLPGDTLARLEEWQGDAFGGADDVRIVPRTNLHVTVAFLGHRPAGELEMITQCLREASRAAGRPTLRLLRYRETRSVGMLVFDDDGSRATALASDLHARLEALGVYEREQRAWLPHATVVRFRRPPRLRPELPDLGEVSPSDAAVYHSLLRRGGAQYEPLQTVRLGGG